MEEKDTTKLEIENALFRHTETEREYIDGRYAIKIVEKVVFGLVTLILTAVVVAIIALVIKK